MTVINKTTVTIWTDGACSGNPGPGGWGALLTWGDHRKEICGGQRATTNQQMELLAAIEALTALHRPCLVVLHSDSNYLIKGMTEWMADWKRRGWRTSQNKPVANVELWRRLEEAAAKHQVQWRWVKGHAGDVGNEQADKLARQGMAPFLNAG